MKKDKLRIEKFSVQSFITDLDQTASQQVKGGEQTNLCPLTLGQNKSLCDFLCVPTEQVFC